METATRVHTKTTSQPRSGIPTNNTWFTDDEMITAFDHGKKAAEKDLRDKILANRSKAQRIAEKFLEELGVKHKIKVKKIHLNVNEYANYKAIFVIPSRVFLSEKKFEEVIDLQSEYYTLHNTVDFSICFYFIPHNSKTNTEAIIADGFQYSFLNG